MDNSRGCKLEAQEVYRKCMIAKGLGFTCSCVYTVPHSFYFIVSIIQKSNKNIIS